VNLPKLKPWQDYGADWLGLQPVRYLADDPGVGKTGCAIEGARRLQLRRVLVVGPKSSVHVWLDEWPRFWPGDPSPIKGMRKLRDEIPEEGHVVCTFNFARERYPDLFIHGRWDLVIVDEFHERRGTDAKATRAIMHPTEGLVARTDRFWALTGTPLANHVGELYPILKLAGVYKGTLDSFVKRYCQVYYDADRGMLKIVGVNKLNLPELHRLLDDSGIMLRRTKTQVMPELPPIVYEEVPVAKGEVDLEALFPEWAMSDSMRELVEEVELQRAAAWRVLSPDAEVERLSFTEAVDTLAGLSESISELLKLIGMQKVGAVIKLIGEELAAGLYPKIFLITRHTLVSEALMHGLKDFGPVRLYGATTSLKRKELIHRFTHDDTCQVFIGQVKACGPSVNLTANMHDGRGGRCYEVGVVEQSAVPGENDQAFQRPHRIGCTRQVRVRLFELDDPVDRRWTQLVSGKSLHIAATMRETRLLSKEFDPIG
jgi:SNF2 family DNA or RNA helicase